jgi:hypothetical protein
MKVTDRELDAWFAAVREDVPEIAPVRAEVLARVAETTAPPRARRPWWIWALAPILASVVPLTMYRLQPPAKLEVTAPPRVVASVPQAAPVTVRTRAAFRRRPVARQTTPVSEPQTLFVDRGAQAEVRMKTSDPDVVIIWVAEQTRGEDNLEE